MTKRIGTFIFAFTLVFAVLTLNSTNPKAFVGSDIVPQPDVMCDLDLGCLINEYVEDVDYNVTWYNQKQITNPDYRNIYMHTDYGITHCSVSLYTAGCAVASMTMLLNYYRGYTTQFVSLLSVNNTVFYSCNYSAVNFENAYPTDVKYTFGNNSSFTNKDQIFALIGPKIDSTHLAILGVKTNAGSTHFVVVSGYTRRTSVFENATIVTYTEIKIQDPAKQNRITLSSLLSEYPIVYRFHVYQDLSN